MRLLRHLVDAGAAVEVLGPAPLKRHDLRLMIQRSEVTYRPLALEHGHARLTAALDGCDSLVHLRYRAPVTKRYWSKVSEETNDNFLETVRLLDAADAAGVEQVCFASSVRVYTPPAYGADEAAPVGGAATPYSMVKLQEEEFLRHWALQTGASSSILRLATVYGPGESGHRAIPNFIRAVLSGQSPIVDGQGAVPFDPVFVGDVAEAFVRALERKACGTFNIGTGRDARPRDVARLVIRLCDRDLDVSENLAAVEHGGLVCDVSRAETALGFKASTSLEAGLRAEIDWMRAPQLRRTA